MKILPFGISKESHAWGTNVYLAPGDKMIFDVGVEVESAPATRGGTLDMYRTKMLAELYKQDGYQIVFKE